MPASMALAPGMGFSSGYQLLRTHSFPALLAAAGTYPILYLANRSIAGWTQQ